MFKVELSREALLVMVPSTKIIKDCELISKYEIKIWVNIKTIFKKLQKSPYFYFLIISFHSLMEPLKSSLIRTWRNPLY